MEKNRFKVVTEMVERKALKTLEGKNLFSEKFGVNTFSRKMMKKYLPKDVFEKLTSTIHAGEPLDPNIANTVAHAMKEWAIDNGVTHFTHWFQPLTGLTAEKHDAFIQTTENGEVIERFSGKELSQGEPDASSFPSGGLRSTFEARGYTVWDPTSPVFIMESANGKTLCIPSCFFSYSGESLDQKTPLLKSIMALEKAAIRVLALFNNKSKRVRVTMGAEQEYFLIDKFLYNMRPDLILAGRTVFGAHSPKGQQMEDHYFGSIKPRVLSYMMEVEEELIKLGIPVKTRHNEVAPNQFEIAPIFEESAVAADHNQVTMEVMRKVAIRHSFALLLHEKPFLGINGSGKHNNFSMCDEAGANLLEPGHTPHDNLQFLVFLLALIRAVKVWGHLLRASVASASNDHRLGANEAPPAIMSVFIGEQLMEVMDRIENDTSMAKAKNSTMDLGLDRLPVVRRDATDRNRTSPFAFTGNKFEFRAVGSSASIAWPNCVLNAIVADSLDALADRVEAKMRTGDDFKKAVLAVLRETITEVRPVIFNGDNYSKEWEKEAEKRGLFNDRDTPTALKHLVSKETIDLLGRYHIFKENELKSRYHIQLEAYIKTVNIEAGLAREMAQTMILPGALTYIQRISQTVKDLSLLSGVDEDGKKAQAELLNELVSASAVLHKEIRNLDKALKKAGEEGDAQKEAEEYRNKVVPTMARMREAGDRIESLMDDDLWTLPKYREMLFLI